MTVFIFLIKSVIITFKYLKEVNNRSIQHAKPNRYIIYFFSKPLIIEAVL